MIGFEQDNAVTVDELEPVGFSFPIQSDCSRFFLINPGIKRLKRKVGANFGPRGPPYTAGVSK
jgi:hypothetical protein